MGSLLGHFNDDFYTAIVPRAVKFVSIDDVCERHAMRDHLTDIDTTAGDKIDRFSCGSLVRLDRRADDRSRTAALVEESIKIKRNGVAQRVAEE